MSSAHLSWTERREQALLDRAIPAETDEQYASRCYGIFAAEMEDLAEAERLGMDLDFAAMRAKALARIPRRDYGRPAYGRKPSPGYGIPA